MTIPSPLAGEGDSPQASGVRGDRPALIQRARAMRRIPTDAEAILWRLLRSRQLQGWKFRRQQPIGPFIVDFVCLEVRLIVEADGCQHSDNARDHTRTAWLERAGFRVLRFWNNDILRNPEGVIVALLDALSTPHPAPPLAESPSPARGEGMERI